MKFKTKSCLNVNTEDSQCGFWLHSESTQPLWVEIDSIYVGVFSGEIQK